MYKSCELNTEDSFDYRLLLQCCQIENPTATDTIIAMITKSPTTTIEIMAAKLMCMPGLTAVVLISVCTVCMYHIYIILLYHWY